MKNNTKYMTLKLFSMLMMLAITFSACEDELDKSPLSNFSSTSFWTSEQNVMLALTGMYRGNISFNGGAVNPSDWWDYGGLLMLELSTDNAYDRRGKNSPLNQLTNGDLVNTNAVVRNYWNVSYSKIARCNYFMENVDKAPISDELKSRMMAEARFLRAAQYFYLSQYFGDVPLVIKVLTAEEANSIDKSPKQDMVNFVIDEFIAAAQDLPRHSDIPDSELGRASKQTALAFLGRIQLSSGKFSDAAETYKTIIDFGDNSIDPNYESLFNGTNEYSDELLFSCVYVENLLGNAFRQKTYIAKAGGWVFYCPLAGMVESYEFTDGTPFSYSDPRYDPDDIRKNRDPRLRYNVLVDGSSFDGLEYVSHPDSLESPDQVTTTKNATRTGYALRKFMVPGYTGDPTVVGNDIPVIRYSEILLSYLEAKLEGGDPINQLLLDETINLVRGRASVDMPPVTETDPGALRPILRRERRNELAFEGLRLWDLLRWGIAGDVLQGRFFGGSFPNANNLREDGNFDDPDDRWYVDSKSFRVGQDETWPVPLNEVNINPGLE